MAGGFPVLSIVLILLLAAVGGLVIWLHIRLHRILKTGRELAPLSDTLQQSLAQARDGLAEVAAATRNDLPPLEAKITAAQQAQQELTYLIDRAEKVANRLEAGSVAMPASAAASPRQSMFSQPSAPEAAAQPRPQSSSATRPAELVMREEDMIPSGAKTSAKTQSRPNTDELRLFAVEAQLAASTVRATVSEAEEDLRRALAGRLL